MLGRVCPSPSSLTEKAGEAHEVRSGGFREVPFWQDKVFKRSVSFATSPAFASRLHVQGLAFTVGRQLFDISGVALKAFWHLLGGSPAKGRFGALGGLRDHTNRGDWGGTYVFAVMS